MTRTIWLCLRCGWRRLDDASAYAAVDAHEERCQLYWTVTRWIRDGRITGGPRSRS